jgi:hypothetical protein
MIYPNQNILMEGIGISVQNAVVKEDGCALTVMRPTDQHETVDHMTIVANEKTIKQMSSGVVHMIIMHLMIHIIVPVDDINVMIIRPITDTTVKQIVALAPLINMDHRYLSKE